MNKAFIDHRVIMGSVMANEYRIKFVMPTDYNPAGLFRKLPGPINRETMGEIYNYRIEKEGFYFIDQAIDRSVASEAFRLFVDEALKYTKTIEITELRNKV